MVDGVDLHLSKEEVVENTVRKINSTYVKLVREVWK